MHASESNEASRLSLLSAPVHALWLYGNHAVALLFLWSHRPANLFTADLQHSPVKCARRDAAEVHAVFFAGMHDDGCSSVAARPNECHVLSSTQVFCGAFNRPSPSKIHWLLCRTKTRDFQLWAELDLRAVMSYVYHVLYDNMCGWLPWAWHGLAVLRGQKV